MVAKNTKEPHRPSKPCRRCRTQILLCIRGRQGLKRISLVHFGETPTAAPPLAIGAPEQETPPTASPPEIGTPGTPPTAPPLAPLLLPPPNSENFTVFLDLDNTLIHAAVEKPEKFDYVITAVIDGDPMTYYIQKRPFVDELLEYLGERFDVVLFICELEEYASPIVEKLDTKKVISHSLYQDSCRTMEDGSLVKDLSLTGRDLSKVLMVDDAQYAFSLQPENGIHIWPFSGNLEDKDLRNLIKFFDVSKDYTDLREALKDFAPLGWRKVEWNLYPSPPATTSDDKASSSGSSKDVDELEGTASSR